MVVEGQACEDIEKVEYVVDDSLNTYVFWDGGEPPIYDYVANSDSNLDASSEIATPASGGI